MLGCKVDNSFLWMALVPMERQAPSAPMDSEGRHLCQLTVGRRPLAGRGGVVGVLGPAESPPPPPPVVSSWMRQCLFKLVDEKYTRWWGQWMRPNDEVCQTLQAPHGGIFAITVFNDCHHA